MALHATARAIADRARRALGGLLPPAGWSDGDALAPSIYRFVLRYSLKEQVYLVIVTLLSFPFLYYSLDLPKLIINDAIGGKHLPRAIFGHAMAQIPYLALLCGIFLVLVLINGAFKYHLNVRKGRLGERMLRRLRYELYQRVLRFPMQRFDRTAAGQIIAMLTAELEPVGGFIGDALALPIAQAGTLLTIFIFMFVQNPLLGAAAISLYPVQGYVIPRMQRRIRALGRERVREVRTLSDRIGESIAARVEIRTNSAVQRQLAGISHRLGVIYNIRFEIYNRKFFVKFLNNLLNQLTPFFFYLIGGYLVIIGDLSFGALVAVLAAYKDLSSPWKELLDFYQDQQDVSIKYEQVVEQFQVRNLIDAGLLFAEAEPPAAVAGDVVLSHVSLVDSDGIRLLDDFSLSLPLGTHAALLGPSNSGKDAVPQMLARLYLPSAGQVAIGGADLLTMPFSASGRLIGYVGATTNLFAASLRENLLLGLSHRPGTAPAGPADAERARAIDEAKRSGNSEPDDGGDWIDYAQAGVADAGELDRRILAVLRLLGLAGDVYLFGLHGRLDVGRHPDTPDQFLEARRLLEQRLHEAGLSRFVERYDSERYNNNASIAENLLFGTAIGPTFAGEGMAENLYLRTVLLRTGLAGDLLRIGHRLAATMVELFGAFASEPGLVGEFGFVGTVELHEFERILTRAEQIGLDALPRPDRVRLIGLATKLVAARDRLGLIDDGLRRRIVAARHAFAAELPESLRGTVEFFDAGRYNAAAQVEQNLLFGTIISGEAGAREEIRSAVGTVLDELGLRDTVILVGLDHQVGNGGSRLSPAQRQLAAIAREVLKRPVLLALAEATAVLDPANESRVLDALRHEFAPGRSIVAALSRPQAAGGFGRVLLMEHGRLVDQGSYEAVLRDRDPALHLAAE
ncbi:MAG TPA: ABC transporter ATP-binding protein/permease [Stellaceae bacterium]|nr:ABC transporter ATP-binding protein/permease [Stellaceae bacterium]